MDEDRNQQDGITIPFQMLDDRKQKWSLRDKCDDLVIFRLWAGVKCVSCLFQ